MMKCQFGTHSSSLPALSMPTQHPLLTPLPLPVSALGSFISGYMVPPGQVAVNAVPRFACCRQFGTRNRPKHGCEWSAHLSFCAPLPARVSFVPCVAFISLMAFQISNSSTRIGHLYSRKCCRTMWTKTSS